MSVGTYTVTCTPQAGGSAVDITCWCDQASIHHGRDDTSSQPDASTCTLDISTDSFAAPIPTAIDVGATIVVRLTIGATTLTRFTGRITDMSQGWEDAGERTPDMATLQVIATGILADLGRRVVGAVPFPQELDGARVSRIMAAAGITLDPLFSDPGTVQILTRDVDSQPALDVAQAVASDANGILSQTTTGLVRYGDADHRRNAVAAVTLDACQVLVTPTWQRSTAGLINSVSIGYGATPAGGEQPRYVASRADSIAQWGTYAVTAATQLAALADATAMGQLLLTRNIQPSWDMPALPIDVKDLNDATTLALLQMDIGDLLGLVGLPAAGTVPTQAMLWLEGWQETLTHGEHDLTLAVSGYCRTVPPPRWNDMLPEQTWDSMGSLTWDNATCIGPLPSRGRWDDTPATLRWNGVAPTITWDTWSY